MDSLPAEWLGGSKVSMLFGRGFHAVDVFAYG